MKYKVVLECLFGVVYTVADGLDEIKATALHDYVQSVLDNDERGDYDGLFVKRVMTYPM